MKSSSKKRKQGTQMVFLRKSETFDETYFVWMFNSSYDYHWQKYKVLNK